MQGNGAENPEVAEAMRERDELLDKVKGAVDKVDLLKDELLKEYAEADALRKNSRRR